MQALRLLDVHAVVALLLGFGVSLWVFRRWRTRPVARWTVAPLAGFAAALATFLALAAAFPRTVVY